MVFSMDSFGCSVARAVINGTQEWYIDKIVFLPSAALSKINICCFHFKLEQILNQFKLLRLDRLAVDLQTTAVGNSGVASPNGPGGPGPHQFLRFVKVKAC